MSRRCPARSSWSPEKYGVIVQRPAQARQRDVKRWRNERGRDTRRPDGQFIISVGHRRRRLADSGVGHHVTRSRCSSLDSPFTDSFVHGFRKYDHLSQSTNHSVLGLFSMFPENFTFKCRHPRSCRGTLKWNTPPAAIILVIAVRLRHCNVESLLCRGHHQIHL